MALIDCKLCGQKISSRAPFCPKCQCPTLPREQSSTRLSEQCRACGLTNGLDDVTCNLCPGATSSAPLDRLVRAAKPSAAAELLAKPAEPGRVSLIASKINGLQVGEEVKERFRLIAENPVHRLVLGMPLFRAADGRLSVWKLGCPGRSLAAIVGLGCAPFYYATRGLWKKGTVLAAFWALLAAGAQMFWVNSWIVAILIGGGVVNLWSCGMVTYDRYRNLVLDEDFWW